MNKMEFLFAFVIDYEKSQPVTVWKIKKVNGF